MFFGIRTTIGQERIVADVLYDRSKKAEGKIAAIAVFPGLKGYLIIEAVDESELRKLVYKVPHVRGVVAGAIDLTEIEHFFEAKPMTAGIGRGDIIELTSGAFKGEKARVIRVDVSKDKVTVEIIEATVPIPVTVDASAARIIEKRATEEPEKKEEKSKEEPEKEVEEKREDKETLGITIKERKSKKNKEDEKMEEEEKKEETEEKSSEERSEPEFLQPREEKEEEKKTEEKEEEKEESEPEEEKAEEKEEETTETSETEEKKEEPAEESASEEEKTEETAESTESTESAEETTEEKKEGE